MSDAELRSYLVKVEEDLYALSAEVNALRIELRATKADMMLLQEALKSSAHSPPAETVEQHERARYAMALDGLTEAKVIYLDFPPRAESTPQ